MHRAQLHSSNQQPRVGLCSPQLHTGGSSGGRGYKASPPQDVGSNASSGAQRCLVSRGVLERRLRLSLVSSTFPEPTPVALCLLPPSKAHTHTGQQPCPPFTFLFPPPGTWLMLSKDPILDCTLSLKSSFSDFTSTWPPPARGEQRRAQSQANSFPTAMCCYEPLNPPPPTPKSPPSQPCRCWYLVCDGCCPGNRIWT